MKLLVTALIFLCVNSISCQSSSDRPPVCFQKPIMGRCKAFFPSFLYDYTRGICQCYIYSGCHASGNHFKTLEDCENTCKPNILSANPDNVQDPKQCLRQLSNPEFNPSIKQAQESSLQEIFQTLESNAFDPLVDRVEHRGEPASPPRILVMQEPTPKPAPIVTTRRPVAPTTTRRAPVRQQSSETTLKNIQKAHEKRLKEQQKLQEEQLQQQKDQQDAIIRKHQEITKVVYTGSGVRSKGRISIGEPISIFG